MPILSKETDIYPDDLFERPETGNEDDRCWWVLYTLSRREKDLMRRLLVMKISFYCPIISQRRRSPSGRLRTSHIPLFSNYVFLYGNEEARYNSLTTNCVSSDVRVVDGKLLTRDLRQIRNLVEQGVPLTRESRFQPGELVRIKTGAFRNFEGYIIRREGKTSLLVTVNFLQQGASLRLDDCEIEPLNCSSSP